MNIMNSKCGFLSVEILCKENKEFLWVRSSILGIIDYENLGRKIMKGWMPIPVDLANHYLTEDTCASLRNNIEITIKDNMFYGGDEEEYQKKYHGMILFSRNIEIGNEEKIAQAHLLEDLKKEIENE